MNSQDTFKFQDFLYFGKLAGSRVLENLASEELAPKKRRQEMISHENVKVIERHGCIVCAKPYNILVVYTPDGRLLDCTVTDPGGHCIPNKGQTLAACDTHSAEEIGRAYQRWQSSNTIIGEIPDKK